MYHNWVDNLLFETGSHAVAWVSSLSHAMARVSGLSFQSTPPSWLSYYFLIMCAVHLCQGWDVEVESVLSQYVGAREWGLGWHQAPLPAEPSHQTNFHSVQVNGEASEVGQVNR